jgi:glyoxylase-like metal-dependent hydrolase (beta-lactamase superfamily II)
VRNDDEVTTMSGDEYEVLIIKYGTRETVRSDVYLNYGVYGQPDAPIRMDYFIWVVRNAARTVLVDTGFSAKGGSDRRRDTVLPPVEAWRRLGITPESAPEIVVTHAHYDHTGHLAHFPGSTIRMARAEFDFWTGPHAHHPLFHHSAQDEDLAGLVAAEAEGRVAFFDDQLELAPGIELLRVGGHTPGQTVVIVQTSDGPVMLASDAVHYLEEYEDALPFMSVANLVDMYAGFDLVRELLTAGTVRHLVPGHDPGTLDRFEPYGEPLDGFAAVIGRRS